LFLDRSHQHIAAIIIPVAALKAAKSAVPFGKKKGAAE
jgi:hypothetical protein